MNGKRFFCSDGCGLMASNSIIWFLRSVEREIRRKTRDPKYELIVTSTARCPKQNKKVGGKRNSAHILSIAADIKYQNNFIKFIIIKHLLWLGVERVGISKRKKFIHFDLGAGIKLAYPTKYMKVYPSPRLWDY